MPASAQAQGQVMWQKAEHSLEVSASPTSFVLEMLQQSLSMIVLKAVTRLPYYFV